MSAKISTLLKDSSIKYSLLLCLFFLFAQSILLAFFYFTLPPIVPFFNSLPWGTERLAASQFMLSLPMGVTIILLINLYISKRIYLKHALIARILTVNGLLISLLGFLAIAQIVLLVF